MNGQTLEPNHGFPVRVVVPGIAGARSVKWLDRITVQLTESANFYQRRDYKILPPEADSREVASKYWHQVPSLQEMPVNSIIAVPQSGTKVATSSDGAVKVKGYALPSGDDGPVVKVEISIDDGISWQEAKLVENKEESEAGVSLKWAWSLWEAEIKMEKGQKRTILSKATDRRGNTQNPSTKWNLRGVAYNGYGQTKDIEIS